MPRIYVCPSCVRGECATCTGTAPGPVEAVACACRHEAPAGGVTSRLHPYPSPSPVLAPEGDVTALRHELDACVTELAVRASLIEGLRARVVELEAGGALPLYPVAPRTLDELQAVLPGAHIEEAGEGEVVIYTGWRVVVAIPDGGQSTAHLVPMDHRPVTEPPSPLLNDPDALPPKPGTLV